MNQNQALIQRIILMHTESLPLLQLLRLCSPALPIGSYAYSQGLETACEHEFINNRESLYQWIIGVMENSMQHLDVPVFSRLYDANNLKDKKQVNYWNQYLLASRETKELYLEDCQIGQALIRLLVDLDVTEAKYWIKKECSLFTAFSLACTHWQIEKITAIHGLLWAWCENQVSIGIKLIPLGQTNGQQVLSRLISHIQPIVDASVQLLDEQIGASCPGLIMSSMQHEEQYTRLFRS